MPFSFSLKHYQTFGETSRELKDHKLASVESWEALRQKHPFFSIGENREEWLRASNLVIAKDGQDARLIERAHDIAAVLRKEKLDSVFTVGAGGAALEYQLKKLLPGVRLTCSDYSPQTVARLQKVFVEADQILEFDIQHGEWRSVQEHYIGPSGLCLIYRVDASFSDSQWIDIFARMAAAGVQHILVIPTGSLTMLSIYNRKKREIIWFLRKIPVIFSGYLRTEKRFYEHWNPWYKTVKGHYGGLAGYLLKLKKPNP